MKWTTLHTLDSFQRSDGTRLVVGSVESVLSASVIAESFREELLPEMIAALMEMSRQVPDESDVPRSN